MRRTVGVAGLAAALSLCSPAGAHVTGLPQTGHLYWADTAGNQIGRSKLDGTGLQPSFITGANSPRAVTVGGSQLYWAHGETQGLIGRSNLDGSGVTQAFIATGSFPNGVSVDSGSIYYAHSLNGQGRIGRARTNGTGANASFLQTATTPCGVAADGDEVYWGNSGEPGAIGSAHGSMDVHQDFITATRDPCGVVVTDTHVYWVNRAGDSIGRAGRSGENVQPNFIPVRAPCGVAVDGRSIYWATSAGLIGHARLDGTEREDNEIAVAPGTCGIAVDPSVRAQPSGYAFPATRPHGRGQVQAFALQNTSSSTLAVSRIDLVGVDARDFGKRGNACVLTATPPGGRCVFNIRFRPRANGTRQALIRVTSNAGGPPLDIPISGRGDERAPRISQPVLTDGTFEAVRSEAVGGKLARGTTFRYRLDEKAKVRFSLSNLSSGKRVGRLSQTGRRGSNRQRLSGSVNGELLRPGRYRARITARDEAGNVSPPRFLRFRVVP